MQIEQRRSLLVLRDKIIIIIVCIKYRLEMGTITMRDVTIKKCEYDVNIRPTIY